mmetsp:Transcript_19807/g.37809  ORF Transcript_19807/g.37809 Transcript_19807/m.37809 type:complete len:82 (+) Transcript_19807:208-453(+)
MTLWTMLQATVLFLNAFAILHEERFLDKYGWGPSAMLEQNQIRGSKSLKSQTIGLIHAISYMRMPLVLTNSVIIFVKVLFG